MRFLYIFRFLIKLYVKVKFFEILQVLIVKVRQITTLHFILVVGPRDVSQRIRENHFRHSLSKGPPSERKGKDKNLSFVVYFFVLW